MKALSIRQPWAWMIVHGWKDIENRDWPTRFRGRFLVHASKGMTYEEYDEAAQLALYIKQQRIPAFADLERGGIIGSVEIFDCTTLSFSRWFFGRYGFVLRAPLVLPFLPLRGQLGFFDVSVISKEPTEGSPTIGGTQVPGRRSELPGDGQK